MLGYDISWAAFNIIEVMSSTKFTFKRTGYLAASQSFHNETEVLMLTTNMIRKDLNSQNIYDAGAAMTGLSCFVTPDLARDLANDVMTLLSSTKPYLRKKAVLLMYKIFLCFPDALRPAFARLKDKLEDLDPGVQSAAVNVICELARKNPKNYLSLAPVFFKLMTSSTNNWMLIKIIKLFGALTPLEPRLGKKLIEPLTNLIHSTSAMSLLYECINTVIAVLISISSGMPNHSASIQLCVQKLRILIEDSDQNLKYLGLLAMSKILKTHPKSVQAHKDLVLQCLDDKDESIRLRALDLLYGMVSKKNLMEIVKKLMLHMDKAEGTNYRDELLSKIIDICSQNNYQYITNFEWYVSILVEITRIEGTKHGALIASQMLDVAIRVPAIRSFAVSQMAVLLDNAHMLVGNTQRNSIYEVLYAAAWICGEFAEMLSDPRGTLEAMLKPKVTVLPPHIQGVYVQNIVKLYSRVVAQLEAEDNKEEAEALGELLVEKLPMFVQNANLEVQDRACGALQLIKQLIKLQSKGEVIGEELQALFSGELNPVAPKAQKKVPVPEGLDLDQWINEPPSESSSEEEVRGDIFVKSDHRMIQQNDVHKMPELTEEELEKRRKARKQEQANNPHYLKATTPSGKSGLISSDKYLQVTGNTSKSRKTKKTRKRSKKGKSVESESDEDSIRSVHVVTITEGEMPEGAKSSDDDEDERNSNDPHKALNIDLEELPLNNEDNVQSHPVSPLSTNAPGKVNLKDEKKKKRRGEKEHKEKTREKKDKSREKHKKKKQKEEDTDLVSSQLIEEKSKEEPVTNGLSPESADKNEQTEKQKNAENTKGQLDDIEFWLSPNDSSQRPNSELGAKVSSSPVPPSDLNLDSVKVKQEKEEKMSSKPEKTKKKKKEKERKSKKEKKKVREHHDSLLQEDSPKDKAEYEEAPGIATPSKEPGSSLAQTPMTPSMPPASKYRLLAEDKNMKLIYETRVLPNSSNQIVVSIIFTNQCGYHVKELEFNILDTLNTRLARGTDGNNQNSVKVPFQLPPGTTNEGQFAFDVDKVVMPQMLRGTFTYMIVTDGGSTHEKLDFKLHLPVSAYFIGSMYKRDTFTELLSSGDLSAKNTLILERVDYEFSHMLSKICFHCHFTVVEQVALSASLYSRSIQGDHVCLLAKQVNSKLTIDGKSTNSQLLSSILDEVKILLNPTENVSPCE
ncbi:AP-3 complex subunit delta-1-like [Limulus polyphemus]|uniref:AP-3 complex subunit delta-1-like n=1 Tax=Limulus polyphemus TaxID=6850 RepID=A0ABM1SKX5_LIMPO|nr:AP-3 complex subunit delta-1-like [Limulus polyphemus]